MTSAAAPIPIRRELVPPPAAEPPEAFALLDESIRGGVPHRFTIGPALAGVIVVPTGVALAWRDADPYAEVTAAARERTPAGWATAPGPSRLDRPPARLLVEGGGALIASLPLVAGMRRPLLAPAAGVAVELLLVDWAIHAGTVRGAGDFGSRISIGWRALAGTGAFVPPLGVPDWDKAPTPEEGQ